MIYLSFCIPTFNRSSYLKLTIDSIISNEEFVNSEEIEIIVSDNCSTDDTKKIMDVYTALFPQKIKYYRNSINIKDKNYEKVLSLGQGQILKLHNDTLILQPKALEQILEITKYCIKKNYVPYFTDGYVKNITKPLMCNNKFNFLKLISYRVTWIGSFSISKKEFDQILNFSNRSELMLCQVDVIFNLLNKGVNFYIVPKKLFSSASPKNKGGYNLPQVFLVNYSIILKDYFIEEHSKIIIEKELKKTAFEFVLPWLIRLYSDRIIICNEYKFEISGYNKIIKSLFNSRTLFLFRIRLFIGIIHKIFVSIIKIPIQKYRSLIKIYN